MLTVALKAISDDHYPAWLGSLHWALRALISFWAFPCKCLEKWRELVVAHFPVGSFHSCLSFKINICKDIQKHVPNILVLFPRHCAINFLGQKQCNISHEMTVQWKWHLHYERLSRIVLLPVADVMMLALDFYEICDICSELEPSCT